MADDKNLFDDLKDMGFDNIDSTELFKSHKKEKQKVVKKMYTVEEVLYDKSYTCPVCGNAFKASAIRSGKNRLLTTDLDLKGTYDIVNPLLYECILCEACGYAALSKNFDRLSISQIKWIREQICSKYKSVQYPKVLSEKDGIIRYKLALLNAQVKHAKDGEKAYICLKIAWLYRDMNNEKMELAFLKNALQGFQNAFSNDRFPIFELDELTVAYLIATIHYRFKEYEEALRWLGNIIINHSTNARLKMRAMNLKDIIKEDKGKSIKESKNGKK